MLKIRFKNNKLNAVWLVEPKVTIGRATSNDLVIDDANVAEQHAEIQVKYENLQIVNLSADKPVYVNRKPIDKIAPLNINDEVILGKTVLQIIDPKLERPANQPPAPPPANTGWALKANSAALANRVFPIKAETVIGRSNECDITLAAAHLSRRHVQLSVRDGVLYVKDLGSANGTFLNGEPVTEARVSRGDELRFDTLSFGVIGPSQDLDKTTVRAAPPRPAAASPAAGAAKPVTAKPASVATASSANAISANVSPANVSPANVSSAKKPAESFSRPESYSPSVTFDERLEEPPAKSKSGLIIGLVLLVLLVATGVAYFQGLLPFDL